MCFFFFTHICGVLNVLMSCPLCSFVTWHMKLYLNEASLVKKRDEYEVCLDCKNVEQAIGDQFICDKTIFGVVGEASLALWRSWGSTFF